MSKRYNPKEIESRWQGVWDEMGVYHAKDFDKRKKYYVLVEFPYPSGERLHVGHGRSYSALDAVARFKRMQGFNVLYPMGWDAFGLPAENYAIKTGIHPSITTKQNIENSKAQAKSWGLSFDWGREINTTDPEYYKWTQWVFLQLFKNGLAYKAKTSVNWCPSCKINLANEEVVGGGCERCGTPVTKREQFQWILAIRRYADRLIEDLSTVDYPDSVKKAQIDWIGRSEGIRIKFQISPNNASRITHHASPIEVFTTRPETIFGATFLVLAPEHPLVAKLLEVKSQKSQPKAGPPLAEKIRNIVEIEDYVHAAKHKTDLERQAEAKGKTGVDTGLKAVNPATGEEIPIWISDFVLLNYGTGAIMSVPAHDQRDFEFAKKFNLPLKQAIISTLNSSLTTLKEAYEGVGFMINSGEFDGLDSGIAKEKISEWLIKKGVAQKSVDYKLRDWIFSRQHYWGEPIPIIYCRRCWEKSKIREGYDYVVIDGERWAVIPVPEEDLPVELPYVERYEPTETGESPLANVKEWVGVECPKCGGEARRETDTMPNWAGSSWYYLRYVDPKNHKLFASSHKLKYWLPVDWYNGGQEHVTLHLLYSRFWHKVLYDLGYVPHPEPYSKRTIHGVVLGPDGRRMSKSRGNVVNPDDVIAEFGADTFRIYEMFMGPFDQMISWNPRGVVGVRRFLDKIWSVHQEIVGADHVSARDVQRKLHQTIKKVGEDIEGAKFNTAIAAMMEFVNFVNNEVPGTRYQVSIDDWKMFLKILAPFAPHLAEELWNEVRRGRTPGVGAPPQAKHRVLEESANRSIHLQSWPKYDPKLVAEEIVTIVVQVNGKLRDKLEVASDAEEAEVKNLALKSERVQKYLKGSPKKVIFVKDKLVNLVV